MKHNILLLLLILLPLSAGAEKHCVFTPIDATHGLSGNKVRNITQLPDGRMMITTEGMVNLYDGTGFSYLHYDDTNICPLSQYAGFHHEYIDAHGYMWLKNQYRLMVVDIGRERFVDRPDSLLASWGVDEPVKDFFMDKARNLWVITDRDDLVYIDHNDLKATVFISAVSSAGLGTDQLYDLGLLNGKLYLFYRSGLLVCYDKESRKELYRQQLSDELPAGKYGNTSYVVPGNNTFYQLCNGPRGGVMLSYNIERRKWDTVLQTDYWLNYLSIDKDGSLWVSCYKGLWNIDADLKNKQYIPTLKLVDGRNIDTEVSTLYNDSQGGMWVGTLNRGMLYYHPDRFRFQNIGRTLFPLPEATNIYVTCFAASADGNVLVGTREGLFRYNLANGIMTPFSPQLASSSCSFLFKDSRQRIWLGTSGGGLHCLMPNGELKHYPLSVHNVSSMTEQSDGTLYLCTDRQGFGIFNPSTGRYEKAPGLPQADDFAVYQLSAAGADMLAGITRNGWFVYDRKKKEYTFHPTSHVCNSIYIDRRQRIWVGMEDGLLLHDPATARQTTFYTTHGLVNNSVRSIVQAPDDALWISTSNGITRIVATGDEFAFANFNQYDGVITDEFCERSAFIAPDGTLFWGGIDGLNKYAPHHAAVERTYSAPLFVGFDLFGERVETGKDYNGNRILKRPITLTEEISLKHDQNFFTLQFSALNYINPTQTYYRYQLTGIDHSEREIRSANGKGMATYTDLPPGTYTFRVQAADNSESWTGRYAEMTITVKAPFWRTAYAYTLYILVAAGSILFIVLAYIRRKRRKLIREQKEKLDEMKSTFLQNINRELAEPIGKIITPLDTILKHTDEGRTKLQLKEIQTNAVELKELVEQLSEGILSPSSPAENELALEELLLNMRQLLEQQEKRKEQLKTTPEALPDDTLLSPADEAFLRKALQYVEQNLDNPEYSVEVLSRDMGMDRTGLYRKLVSVVGKTPTNFIRSIRLKRAAQLLEEGHTVAEVADRVGFSTSSYLSKCFQEEFGMRPVQYVNSLKERCR